MLPIAACVLTAKYSVVHFESLNLNQMLNTPTVNLLVPIYFILEMI